MALQTSGEISLYNIRNEFDQPFPVPLQDYYRGGGIVPDISENSSVPTSGSISVQDFYGATDLLQRTKDFISRVESDGGQVSDAGFIDSFYRDMSSHASFLDSHGMVFFPEARKVSSGRVTKMYCLYNSLYDVESGNGGYSAPILNSSTRDSLTFDRSTDGLQFTTDTALDFLRNRGWVSNFTVHNRFGSQPNMGYLIWWGRASGVNNQHMRYVNFHNSNSLAEEGGARIPDTNYENIRATPDMEGTRTLYFVSDFQNGHMELFRNGSSIGSRSQNSGTTDDTRSWNGSIGNRQSTDGTNFSNADLYSVSCFKSQPSSGLVTDFHNFYSQTYH